MRKIVLIPSCFITKIVMEITVPKDRDEEEYIDEVLDSILNDEIRYNGEWAFCD